MPFGRCTGQNPVLSFRVDVKPIETSFRSRRFRRSRLLLERSGGVIVRVLHGLSGGCFDGAGGGPGGRVLSRLVGFVAAAVLTLGLLLVFANPAWAETISVTTTNDENNNTGTGQGCSLREAVIAANTNTPRGGCPTGGGADTILVPDLGNYALTIGGRNEDGARTGDLDITSAVDVQGADQGSTVAPRDNAAIDRAFDIRPGGNATVSRLTISGGNAQQVGGGLRNAGTLALNNSVIEGNNTGQTGPVNERRGGGIYNLGSGTLTLDNTVVQNNQSFGDGGGIFNFGGDVELTDSTVSGNTAGDDGGGISNRNGGSLTLTRSTVSNNTAQGASLPRAWAAASAS